MRTEKFAFQFRIFSSSYEKSSSRKWYEWWEWKWESIGGKGTSIRTIKNLFMYSDSLCHGSLVLYLSTVPCSEGSPFPFDLSIRPFSQMIDSLNRWNHFSENLQFFWALISLKWKTQKSPHEFSSKSWAYACQWTKSIEKELLRNG